jgi:hypothetical protein
MPDIQKIWFDFLHCIMIDTFSEFLDNEEIIKRCNWIISKLFEIDPDIIFKNILYMIRFISISEIAIGYKIHFITDDYKVLFNNPYSEEFDKNNSLSKEDKELLNIFIHNFCKTINHHIELLIHDPNYNSKTSIDDLIYTIKEISTFYKLPKFEIMSSMFVKDGYILYKMSIGQILYMVSFNQNPYTSLPCQEELIENIRCNYSHRLNMMDCLKKTWPNGIPLKYVLSNKIF